MPLLKKGEPITFVHIVVWLAATFFLTLMCYSVTYSLWNEISMDVSPKIFAAYILSVLVILLSVCGLIQLFVEAWIPMFRLVRNALRQGLRKST